MWAWWTVAALTWVLVWIVLCARATAVMRSDARVLWLGRALPMLAATTCILLFGASRERGSFTATFVLWMHHASIALLFAFLAAGQYLQVEAWWKLRRGVPAESIAETYRRLWTLAEIVQRQRPQ